MVINRFVVTTILAGLSGAGAVHAAVVTSSSIFATGAAVGARAPDSITDLNGSIYVQYGNGVDSTGNVPGNSTIVQYSPAGAIQSSISIAGSVDGLKANTVTGQLWALQNQDGNATLTLIDPVTGARTGPLSYAAPPYIYGANSARGYDDVAFLDGKVYLSYTNPASATDPVVQQLDNGNTPSGVLTVTDIVLAGQTGIPQPDIDSLKATPDGRLVVTAGDDGRYSVITDPGLSGQTVSTVQITDAAGVAVSGLDDVLFPQSASGTLYVSGTNSNDILALNVANLDPNSPIVSIGSLGELATVDPGTGVATPFFKSASLVGPHGLDLVAVPEPSALAMLAIALAGLFGLRLRREGDRA